MKSCKLAVVVPVDPTGDDKRLKAEVWAKVTALLTQYLGKFYGRFYPVQKAWGHDIHDKLGIVLGKDDPLTFLGILGSAKEIQDEATDFHMGFLMKEVDKTLSAIENGVAVQPIVINEDDKALLFHTIWNVLAQDGTILPDLGIFYAEHNRAKISPFEEKAMLSHLAKYAICVVELTPEGEDNG